MEFGKANFKNLTDGSVTIKYSKAEFTKLSGKVNLKLEFCSAVKILLDNSLTGLDVKASYSTVNLKPVIRSVSLLCHQYQFRRVKKPYGY